MYSEDGQCSYFGMMQRLSNNIPDAIVPQLSHTYTLGVSPSLASRWREGSGVFEDLKFKISEGYDQFWSEPSEINLRSSTTPETVAFTPP